MYKRILALALALSFGLVTTFAAQATGLTAKVTAVDGNKVQITIQSDAPAWLKKNAVVKVTDESGKVLETAAKVTEVGEKTYTVTTKEAATVKAGDTVSLQKGRVMSGC